MAVVRGSLHKNESDRHPLQEFASTFAGWVRTAPNYWAGSIVFFPGVALTRVVKYGPWDENSESELQAFIDFQSDYSNMFSINITNVSNAEIANVLVGAGSPNGRNIETGALIESDYNKMPGVWDLIIDTVIENHASGVGYSCSAVRLGGMAPFILLVSLLSLVRSRDPHGSHVREAKFCLRVSQVIFLGFSRFNPTYCLSGPSQMSYKNLEKEVKQNPKIY